MLLSFAFLILAQVNGQQPGEDVGISDASTILDGAINGSRLIVSSFKQDWQDLGNGNSPVYTAVVGVSLLGAVVLISFWSLGWYAKIAEYGLCPEVIDEMIYPFIVAMMLAVNHGALLANTSLGFRAISNHLNDSVLSITRNGVQLREAIRDVNMNQAFTLAVKAQIEECKKEPKTVKDDKGNTSSPRAICESQVSANAEQNAKEYRIKHGIATSQNSWNPLDLGGGLVNSVVEGLAYIIFSGLEAGFQYIVQLSFLLNAYIGPIFLVLSLLPVGAKAIYIWTSGWLALGLIQMSYSIVVGIAASSIVNSSSTNPLFFPLITAILSPLLAVGIGAGGGMALFTSFTSATKSLLKG